MTCLPKKVRLEESNFWEALHIAVFPLFVPFFDSADLLAFPAVCPQRLKPLRIFLQEKQ